MTLEKKLKKLIAIILATIIFLTTLNYEGIYSINGAENINEDYDLYNISVESSKTLYVSQNHSQYWTNGDEVCISRNHSNGEILTKAECDRIIIGSRRNILCKFE